MAKDYAKRLQGLRNRRLGLLEQEGLFPDTLAQRIQKRELYESRDNRGSVKYALGAMQEVDKSYTAISVDEAARVEKKLDAGLERENIRTEFRLQGSVPLNIHTKGASDVDLLVFHRGFLTYDEGGVRARAGYYTPNYEIVPLERVSNLRAKAETVLQTSYYGADVDCDGAKSIKLSKGSFRRIVDVVPCYWNDSVAYQQSQQEHDRQVYIYDKDNHRVIANLPFLYMKKVQDKDDIVAGGFKKIIRLVKNIRNDALDEGKPVDLSSYDIASLLWHCRDSDLVVNTWTELRLLEVAERYFSYWASNHEAAMSLVTPDGSRKVIDSADKFKRLVGLSAEITALLKDVSEEIAGSLLQMPVNREGIARLIQEAYVA